MMPEHPEAANRIALGTCLGCGEWHGEPLGDGPFFGSEACAIAYRAHHGCGDEKDYCGSCYYEQAMFCLFTDGSGPLSYCGKPPEHEGKHARRMTPTHPELHPRNRPRGIKGSCIGCGSSNHADCRSKADVQGAAETMAGLRLPLSNKGAS